MASYSSNRARSRATDARRDRVYSSPAKTTGAGVPLCRGGLAVDAATERVRCHGCDRGRAGRAEDSLGGIATREPDPAVVPGLLASTGQNLGGWARVLRVSRA